MIRESDAKALSWIAGIIAGILSLCAFVFGNFETIEHSKDMRIEMSRKLDRMEDKIDSLIQSSLKQHK